MLGLLRDDGTVAGAPALLERIADVRGLVSSWQQAGVDVSLRDDAGQVQAALRRVHGLTEREREVFAEIGRGRTNAEVARGLHMSQATVKTHVSHLFDKLAVTNRVQVAILAHDAGLTD